MSKRLTATVLLGVAISLSPSAKAQEQPWEAALKQQLLAEKDCELNYLTDIRSFELLGRQTVKARAHCMDERAFDVTQEGEDAAFTFESCEVVTC